MLQPQARHHARGTHSSAFLRCGGGDVGRASAAARSCKRGMRRSVRRTPPPRRTAAARQFGRSRLSSRQYCARDGCEGVACGRGRRARRQVAMVYKVRSDGHIDAALLGLHWATACANRVATADGSTQGRHGLKCCKPAHAARSSNSYIV
eukprot:365942-Chlamydomonas_euryale.AAC.90